MNCNYVLHTMSGPPLQMQAYIHDRGVILPRCSSALGVNVFLRPAAGTTLPTILGLVCPSFSVAKRTAIGQCFSWTTFMDRVVLIDGFRRISMARIGMCTYTNVNGRQSGIGRYLTHKLLSDPPLRKDKIYVSRRHGARTTCSLSLDAL
jgi:hypothetical protein